MSAARGQVSLAVKPPGLGTGSGVRLPGENGTARRCCRRLISEKGTPHFRSYQESVEHGSLGRNYALISLPVINNVSGDKYSTWAPKQQGWHLSLGLFSSVKGQGLLMKAGAALIAPPN